MDSVVAAVDFSLHQTGIATPPVGHSQAAIGGAFPQQQPPLHVKQNNDSSFHVSVIPLYIIETSTPVIVAFSNTQHVISLKLTNTNYLIGECR
jgi:hypothetical protein